MSSAVPRKPHKTQESWEYQLSAFAPEFDEFLRDRFTRSRLSPVSRYEYPLIKNDTWWHVLSNRGRRLRLFLEVVSTRRFLETDGRVIIREAVFSACLRSKFNRPTGISGRIFAWHITNHFQNHGSGLLSTLADNAASQIKNRKWSYQLCTLEYLRPHTATLQNHSKHHPHRDFRKENFETEKFRREFSRTIWRNTDQRTNGRAKKQRVMQFKQRTVSFRKRM